MDFNNSCPRKKRNNGNAQTIFIGTFYTERSICSGIKKSRNHEKVKSWKIISEKVKF